MDAATKDRLEFNRLWWGDVAEGEQIAQDEITEVRWLVAEVQRLYDMIALSDAVNGATECPVCGASPLMSGMIEPQD